MSGAAAALGDIGGGIGRTLGISDPSSAGLIGGGFLGSRLGLGGAIAGGAAGKKSGQRIEQARAQAAADEAQRRQFNEEIFQLAESLSGRVGQVRPDFDFEELAFSGQDPRQERLQSLVNLFQRRQQEFEQQSFAPGLSQTRLSLLE